MNPTSSRDGGKTGSVTLVGAGPGDPDLLTLAAVKAIASADVILVDDLVHPAVLDHAAPAARIVHVGKRGPYCRVDLERGSETLRPSTPQAFIERLMIVEATKGLQVVRLKGGDPFVFGRGGEEKAHLEQAGIAVRVIPGISSGIAGPAAIGIPVTHRDWSQGVVFVTGHRRRQSDGGDDGAGFAPDLDWAAIAATGLTLVIYMGIGRVQVIVDALIEGGLDRDLPAAAIQSAWTEGQRQVVGSLATLPADIAAADLGSPAVLVIGNVVRCADRRWLAIAGEGVARPASFGRTVG
jgi:uroporphyrin-III C-methyltransferase